MRKTAFCIAIMIVISSFALTACGKKPGRLEHPSATSESAF